MLVWIYIYVYFNVLKSTSVYNDIYTRVELQVNYIYIYIYCDLILQKKDESCQP